MQKRLISALAKNKKLNLLYRGSRDGYAFDKTHSKIDVKGPTLTIVKSDTYNIFGGYTPISWGNSGGTQKQNGTSFLFSFRRDESIRKLEHVNGYEVYHSNNFLVNFMYNIRIKPNCDKNKNSQVSCDREYGKPDNYNDQ